MLGAGWPGATAWPGETPRDGPQEEEDAPTQQEKEMKWMMMDGGVSGSSPHTLTCLWGLNTVLLMTLSGTTEGDILSTRGLFRRNVFPSNCKFGHLHAVQT